MYTHFLRCKKMSSDSMMKCLDEMKGLISILERDVATLSGGKKNAAPQARKSASALQKQCGAIRVAILDFHKGMPVKARVVKDKAPDVIDVKAETAAAVAEMPMLEVPDINVPVKPKRKSRAKAVA